MSEAAFRVLLRMYPRALRREYGAELGAVYRALRSEARHKTIGGRIRLWLFLLRDLLGSIAHERERAVHARASTRERPPYFDGAIAGLTVFALYVATLAPTVAFWDTGEYMTAAHTLGIPHAPGNPLFVLLAGAWSRVLSVFGIPVAVRMNLFSAALSASAHAFWFLVIDRGLQGLKLERWVRRLGAGAAVALSATAFTVWNQSNVNEKVYTLSLFTIALVSWLLLRWRDRGRGPRRLVVIAFLIALSATNHLMGVLVVPAVLAFIAVVDGRTLLRPALWAGMLAVAALGLLPQLFLPLRANQRPILAEAEPACTSLGEAVASIYTWGRAGCPALSSSLRREQYDKPDILLDPTVYPQVERSRDVRLFGYQVLNWVQYLDWQWARSIAGSDPLFGGARPLITLLFVAFAMLGAQAHWRSDRASALYLAVLFLTLSFGLIVYLNFKYGFAIGRDAFPANEAHEVRERDYFFLIGFSIFGLWCGVGLLALWQRLARALSVHVSFARAAVAPVFGLALLPLGLNWEWSSRANDYAARDWAYNVLMSVAPYGVLFTNGDNDTFPLWYLQEVEGLRRDVTVMVTGYLNTDWYARQVRDLTRPCPPGVSAATDPTRIICQRPLESGQLPPVLAARAADTTVPDDSILPLTDTEIANIAATPFVTEESLELRAGALQTTIPAGTVMFPADTFVAAILKATLGKRPIYFAAPHPTIDKLGLHAHTVRHGLTLALYDGLPQPSQTSGIIALPESPLSPVTGAFVELPFTESLLRTAFVQRGRLLEPDRPLVDLAVSNILLQYAWVHYTAAQAYAVKDSASAAERHVRAAQWWEARTQGF